MIIFPEGSPYEKLNTLTITDRCNGYLNVERLLDKWREACVKFQFLTRSMYKALSPEDQDKIRSKIAGWKTVGGLEMPMNGAGDNFYEALGELERAEAAANSRSDRIGAKWKDKTELKGTRWYNPNAKEKDKDYLVAPDGSMEAGNGQPYGIYTGPLDYIEKTSIFGGRFTI